MGKGQERVTQINLVLTKRVTSQHPWRIHWNSELGYFIFEILKECPFKVNFYIMFLLTPVSDKLTQEKARWRPSCKRSLICLMSHEGPMCQSAQIWQGASRYQTSTINNWTLYPLPSHPDRLTERELVDVTTVFHAFESGVRSGTMHQDWLKEVWKYSINIQSNQSKFHYLQGDEHAGSESQRAGGDWHPKPRRQVETILLTQNGVKRPKCNILWHEIMYQGQLDLLSRLLPNCVGQDAQPNRGGGVCYNVSQLDHHDPEKIASC